MEGLELEGFGNLRLSSADVECKFARGLISMQNAWLGAWQASSNLSEV